MSAFLDTGRGTALDRPPFLLHLALSAICIAQPFYSITGTNLDFFVAWRMGGVEFAAWVLLVYAAPPLATYLLVWLGYRLHRSLGRVLTVVVCWTYVSLATMMAAGQMGRHVQLVPSVVASSAVYVLLMVLSAVLTLLLLSKRKVRGALQLFAVLTVIFPALMLWRGLELGVIRLSSVPAAQKIAAASLPNVVLIVFDELPLTTILDADGLIDRQKFPNFYQFSQGSTWFANARSVAGGTEKAVPAILSGRLAKGAVPPTYGNYPENIFHSLGPSYDVLDFQSVTDLNPFRRPSDEADAPFYERFRRIGLDIAIIVAHLAAPPPLASKLPPINRQLNRFGEDVAGSPRGTHHNDRFIAGLRNARQPFLAVYHNEYPHNAWNHYPSGTPYPVPRSGDYISIDRKADRIRLDDARIRHDYQAHLLQSMHADRLLGGLITELKKSGAYDHSIIAVVADHGVSLWPGEDPRDPSVSHRRDVFAVPLIVKLPDQSHPLISLDRVKTTDIYPTILDYLGVAPPGSVEGKSFLGSVRQALPADTVKSSSYRGDPTLKRRMRWFGTGVSSQDLYGFGEFRNYIGHSVKEFKFTRMPDAVAEILGSNGIRRTAVPDSARIEAQIRGGLPTDEVQSILVALGDRFCGATQTTDLQEDGLANTFTLILAEDCLGSIRRSRLRVFVLDAFEHLAEIPVDEISPDLAPKKLAELIASLTLVRGTKTGRQRLPMLRELGVDVPDMFISDDELEGPWGDLAISNEGSRWVIDFYSTPTDTCSTLLLAANQLRGVTRLATSEAAAEEISVPATAKDIERKCANASSGLVRIIVENRPALPRAARVIEELAQLVDALKQTGTGLEGRIDLQRLQELGASVPNLFAADGHFAWPWGEVGIQKHDGRWIIDLRSAPKNICKAVLLATNGIPDIARVATTEFARDETDTPVATEYAEQNCLDPRVDVIRIITTPGSAAKRAKED